MDRGAGDYRLNSAGSLVDYCDWSVLGSLSDYSANGLTRPNDLPAANVFGDWDLGGIETYPQDSIFEDSFGD